VRNTLIFTAGSVPLGMLVALSLALLLNCDIRGRVFFRTLFFLPAIVPAVASSMIWLWMFNGEAGLVNWVLGPVFRLAGATPPTWLADPAWAKPALILMTLWGTGNSMIIYLAGLQDIPRELHEAATIDGAGTWARFRHVTVPLISPVLYFDLIMGVIGSMQVFTQAYIMRGDGAAYLPDGAPAESTLFLTVYLFSNAFHQLRMGYACAMACILFLATLGCTWLVHRAARRRVHYTN
jgi:multiple sugar transport system permease protein